MIDLDDIQLIGKRTPKNNYAFRAWITFESWETVSSVMPIARRTIMEDEARLLVFRDIYGGVADHIERQFAKVEEGQWTEAELIDEMKRLIPVLRGTEPLHPNITQFVSDTSDPLL